MKEVVYLCKEASESFCLRRAAINAGVRLSFLEEHIAFAIPPKISDNKIVLLMLSDLVLGDQLFSFIKMLNNKLPRKKQIPIVILSYGELTPAEELELYKLGVCYVSKNPLDEIQVVAGVVNSLKALTTKLKG